MQGGDGQNYPSYEDEDKQEAARFLLSEFENIDGREKTDDFHATPVIQGITDESRLHSWIEVKKDHPERVAKADKDALRQRLRELAVDEDVTFERASEISTDADPEPAVADGGAVVEESDDEEPNTSVSRDDWEIGPDQEAMTYEDEADFQSKKNKKRRTVWDLVTTVEEAESALDRQYSKDTVPRHTVELLEERLEELEQ